MTRTIPYVAAFAIAVVLSAFESRVVAQEESADIAADATADSDANSGETSADAGSESQPADANSNAQSTSAAEDSARSQSSADVNADIQSRDRGTRADADYDADVDRDRSRTDRNAPTYRSRDRDRNGDDRGRNRDYQNDRDRNRDYQGRDRDDRDWDRNQDFRDRDDRDWDRDRDFRDRDNRDWDRGDRNSRNRDFRDRDDRDFGGRDRDVDHGIHFGRRTDRGLLIDDIERGSFYFSAGLRTGDVLISLDGRPIRSEADFHRYVRNYYGQRVPLIVIRDGYRETIYVEYPEQTVYRERVYRDRPESGAAYLGVVFDANVRDAAVVHTVVPGSPAEEAGLERDDMILALNGREVISYQDAISTIRSMRPGDVLEIVLVRGRTEAETEAVLDAKPLRTARAGQSEVRVEERPVYVEPPPQGEYDEDYYRRGDDRRFFERDRDDDGQRDRGLLDRILD